MSAPRTSPALPLSARSAGICSTTSRRLSMVWFVGLSAAVSLTLVLAVAGLGSAATTAAPSPRASGPEPRPMTTGIPAGIDGALGGDRRALVVADESTVFAGVGARIVRYEATGFDDWREAGTSDVLPGVVNDVVTHADGRVFVAHDKGFDQLTRLDHSSMGIRIGPRELGPVQSVEVTGDLAVALVGALSPHGLVVYDLNRLEPISQVGTPAGVYGTDVAVAGEHAYVASWSQLRIVSFADPSRPAHVSDVPIAARAVTMHDGRLLVGTDGQIQAYDVSQPAARV